MTADPGLRIALLITRFPPLHIGGAELQAARLARRLADRHEVTIFTRGGRGTPSLESIDGYTVVRRKVLEVAGPVRLGSDIVSGMRSLSRHGKKIDIAVAYQIVTAGYLAHLFKKRTGTPYIVSIRGESEYKDYTDPRRGMIPPVLRTADRILLQSPLLLDDFSRECGNFLDPRLVLPRCGYLPNGVDRAPGPASSGEIITFIGRLIPDKNPRAVIETSKILSERGLRRISWVVVGDGPERSWMEKMTGELNLPVTFTGTIPPERLTQHLRRSRCLLLPSRFGEGLPNVILEAMAHGVPCIATDVGGTRDLVRNNETGLLVDPDDTDGFAEAVLKLFSDEELHARMTRACLERVEPFYWENVIGEYETLLNDLVRKTR